MSGAGVGVFVVAVLVGIGLALGLYVLVRAEAGDRAVVSRADAERLARRDTDDEE